MVAQNDVEHSFYYSGRLSANILKLQKKTRFINLPFDMNICEEKQKKTESQKNSNDLQNFDLKPLIDIYNNIIEYNGVRVNVITDNKNMPWFNGSSVAKILNYKRANNSINNHVECLNKKTFNELKHLVKTKIKNMQPHTVYINEFGLHSLILSSNMPNAILFKKWIIENVLPTIRKTGIYKSETGEEELKTLNVKLNNNLVS